MNLDPSLRFAWRAYTYAQDARIDAWRMIKKTPGSWEKLSPLVTNIWSRMNQLHKAINEERSVHMVMYAQDVNRAHDELRNAIESLQDGEVAPRTPRGRLIPPGVVL